MSKLTLVRLSHAAPADSDLERVRHVIFNWLDGLGRDDKRGWRKFWKRMLGLEPGEVIEFTVEFPRSGPHHRLFFAMITRIHDAQERIIDFEVFRYWVLISAGHVEWIAGAKGGVVPVAKSISYSALDEHHFTEVHSKVLDFLRTDECSDFLWPHLKGQRASDMMNTIINEFEEYAAT